MSGGPVVVRFVQRNRPFAGVANQDKFLALFVLTTSR